MFVYLGIVALITIRGSNAQEPCMIASLTPGVCISIYNCDPFLNLLRQGSGIPPRDVEFLRASQCGYDGIAPKVCCPRRIEAPRLLPMDTNPDPKPSPAVVPGPPDVRNHPRLKLVNDQICGPVTDTKILLGNLTTVLEFPWMALIAYNINGRRTDFRCGGTLISKRYVLTAAHCVTGLETGFVVAGVRIGEHNLSREQDCDEEDGMPTVCAAKYQNFFVQSYHVHEGYVKKTHENDIALIRMDGDANFEANNVRPICLPVGNNAMPMSKKAIVTGWGRTEKYYKSDSLLKVRLPLIPNEECNRVYKVNGLEITFKQICAGGHNRMDSCTGDSGGPLQYPDVNTTTTPKYVQYGIVSYGPDPCGVKGSPGVYTNVAYYMNWILDTMRE